MSTTLSKNCMSVRFSVSSAFCATEPLKPTGSMICEWDKSGVLNVKFQASKDPLQIPDLIVTLMKGTAPKQIPIAYRRITAVSLLKNTAFPLIPDDSDRLDAGEPKLTWIHLKEDKATDAINDTIFPGSLLVKVGMYAVEKPEESAAPWKEVRQSEDRRTAGAKDGWSEATAKTFYHLPA
jgi:hypothetical protein